MEKQIGRYGNKSSLSKTTSDLNKQEINYKIIDFYVTFLLLYLGELT